MKALISVSGEEGQDFFILSILVICLSALRSSPCPSLSYLYGKELHSPGSLALASWLGPTNKATFASMFLPGLKNQY